MSFLRWISVLALMSASVASAADPSWEPGKFASAETVELRTDVPGEGEYWFPVWVVVVDGAPYIRLGSRAADRFEHNQTAPVLSIRLDGRQYDQVRGEAAPEQAEAVNQAMAAKYWSDFFIRWFPHPLTLRLVPAESPVAP